MKTTRSSLLVFRDIVRICFIFSFFFLPEITEKLFGIEFEFENEYIVIVAIMLFGTFWCGWFCPFGNVQYFASIIGKTCFPNLQITIPTRYDSLLRYLKYAFLLMFIYVFVTQKYGYFDDHIKMYKSTWYSYAYLSFKKPWAILIIPLLIPRFFCKYLCYQKAGYQIINRILPFMSIKRNTTACISCKKCNNHCSMEIDLANKEKVTGGECVGCLSCVDNNSCPTDPTSLDLCWFGKKIPPLIFAIAVLTAYILLTFIMIFFFRSIH